MPHRRDVGDGAPSRVPGDDSFNDAHRHDLRGAHDDTFPTSETPRAPTTIDGSPSDVLIERIRQGDRDAFSALYLAFYERLWRLAVILGEPPDVGQELVQEIFLSLWTRRESLVVREDIAVYLLSAVRHRVYKSTRHTRVTSRFAESAAQVGERMFDPRDSADMDVEQLRQAIALALESLSERERAALMLRWGEERTYDEIGVVLGVSAMGAHKMVTRALSRVRPLLERFRDYAGR